MQEKNSARNGFDATLVLKNGVIHTMDGQDTVVSAVAVFHDKIIYAGNDEGAVTYIGKDTKVVDLEGKMAVPGFVDGHIHAASEQVDRLYHLYLAGVDPTVASYQAALADFAAKHREEKVIYGSNFQINAFEENGPTKEMLDRIVSDRIVFISDSSFHAFWLNSRALAEIGVTRDTETPAGGRIARDEKGEPTGYLVDCQELWEPLLELLVVTPEQYLEAFKLFQRESAEKGITAVNSMGVELWGKTLWKTISDYAKTGEMTLRASYALNMTPEDDAAEVIETMRDGQQYRSELLQVNTVKLFADGVVEGRTAYLLESYAPEAGLPEGFRGEPIWSDDALDAAVTAIDRAGFQVHIHAIADGAARQALNSIERAFGKNGMRDARHSLTHLTLVSSEDIERMGRLGVIAAMQPVWFYNDPLFSGFDRQMLGEERFNRMYALRDMVEAGVVITGSSDSPATPDNRPLIGMETAVTRCSPYGEEKYDADYVRNPAQAVSVLEMLKAYTINGAKAMSMEPLIGSIEVGKKADLVVLGKDITKVDPREISDIPIDCTIFDGRIVYRREK